MTNMIPIEPQKRLEVSLQPAGLDEAEAAAEVLATSLAILPSIQDPPAFKAIMAKYLAPYPADVLIAAVDQAIHDFKHMPSISEMIGLCERRVEPRREELRRLERIEHEKQRAAVEAERAAQRAAAEAERAAQRAAKEEARRQALQEVEERARERLGEAAPFPGDVALAASINQLPSRGPWLPALDRGEEWAAKFCRLAALAARIRNAISEGRAHWDEGLQLAKRLDTDEPGVRESIGALEQRLPGPSEVPTKAFFRQIWRVHRACGCDLPPGIFPDDTAAALAQSSALAELANVQMPLDQWSGKRRGIEAAEAIMNRWRDDQAR